MRYLVTLKRQYNVEAPSREDAILRAFDMDAGEQCEADWDIAVDELPTEAERHV